MIRRPRPQELRILPQIENAADRRYARVGLRLVLDMPPAPLATLEQARRLGRLWIAASPVGRPVGFALLKLRHDTAWLDQLSVLDRWQRLGIGSRLIEETARAARALGFPALHLSTYRDVPWNQPYYERRGFRVVAPTGCIAAVRQQLALEASHGHPGRRRTAMVRPLGA